MWAVSCECKQMFTILSKSNSVASGCRSVLCGLSLQPRLHIRFWDIFWKNPDYFHSLDSDQDPESLLFGFFLKVWWQDATLFVQYIYPSVFAGASLHLLVACKLSGKNPPYGAEPRIELGPALQQADALPAEQRRTIKIDIGKKGAIFFT
jgi:hypothetical protein